MVKVAEWNNSRGEIQIHRPGCADLKKTRGGADVFEYEVDTFKDIVLGVYPPEDFEYDADTEWRDYSGDIRLMPCCPSIPDEAAVDAPQIELEATNTRSGYRLTSHTHKACGHDLTPVARAACRKTHTWNGEAWV